MASITRINLLYILIPTTHLLVVVINLRDRQTCMNNVFDYFALPSCHPHLLPTQPPGRHTTPPPLLTPAQYTPTATTAVLPVPRFLLAFLRNARCRPLHECCRHDRLAAGAGRRALPTTPIMANDSSHGRCNTAPAAQLMAGHRRGPWWRPHHPEDGCGSELQPRRLPRRGRHNHGQRALQRAHGWADQDSAGQGARGRVLPSHGRPLIALAGGEEAKAVEDGRSPPSEL